MKHFSLVLLSALILSVAGSPCLAQGDGEIKIVIPEFNLKVPVVSVTASGTAVQIMENHLTRTIESNNEVVQVMGNHNKLLIKGTCPEVQVLGNHNTVSVETTPRLSLAGNHNTVTAAVGEGIAVMGNYNHLTWTPAADKDPAVSNLGNQNVITRGQ